MAMATAMNVAQPNTIALKIRESAEFFEAGIDFGSREGAESLHAKAFAAEAPHHGAVDDRAAQFSAADVVLLQVETLLRQVADEASREAVPRAGGIEHILQQITRNHEE